MLQPATSGSKYMAPSMRKTVQQAQPQNGRLRKMHLKGTGTRRSPRSRERFQKQRATLALLASGKVIPSQPGTIGRSEKINATRRCRAATTW
eukprot:1746948-Prymnesium_polylepis.1